MRRMSVALSGVVTALVVGMAGPAIAGSTRTVAKVTDPKGDVADCRTGASADDPVPDIRSVQVKRTPNGRYFVRVKLARSFRKSLRDEFSFAIEMQVIEADGTTRVFLVQVHGDDETIGEVAPGTDRLLHGSEMIDVGKKAEIDLPDDLEAPFDVAVRTFHSPAEGEPVTCDAAGVSVGD